MALLGCPLLGDSIYGPLHHYGLEEVKQRHAQHQERRQRDVAAVSAASLTALETWWGYGAPDLRQEPDDRVLRSVETRVGLQAYRLELDCLRSSQDRDMWGLGPGSGNSLAFEAGTPWWRSESAYKFARSKSS